MRGQTRGEIVRLTKPKKSSWTKDENIVWEFDSQQPSENPTSENPTPDQIEKDLAVMGHEHAPSAWGSMYCACGTVVPCAVVAELRKNGEWRSKYCACGTVGEH